MQNYKKINNIVGWAVFAIAAFTYVSTAESTASLWDCSEFITSAKKLEVGHPPGAPLFMMLGHLFTMFVADENAGYMINVFSALCSAFTILFLFWSITILARKIVGSDGEDVSSDDGDDDTRSSSTLVSGKTLAAMGCGIIGALIYTFSDTFWFSAVEGEVYSASSLITAAVFWAILKWDENADSEYANRWLLLIAYITGLSIGVHLLNLLVVPAIVFVYYFRKYKVTRNGVIKTGVVSIVLLAGLVWGIIPFTPLAASWIELAFVNGFGLPVNSGLLFFTVVLAAALVYGVNYTRKRGKPVANTIMLALSLCMLGYGSYAMIVIRSSANLPMDQNKPDNIFALIKYLNRDQYGSRPLFTGAYYNNASNYSIIAKEKYIRLGDKYVKKDIEQTLKYEQTVLFPRMWSPKEEHKAVYKGYVRGDNPTFTDNMRFFFSYQLGFMYWRYFLWNFAGRQNDMQATHDDLTKGNWMSGIKPWDEARLGPMDDMPSYLAENKGANKYYLIPLIFGLLGIIYQYRRDKKSFAIVTMLFFFTGIAIIVYLNQTPNEPRERDYAYAGSFYAYAIWTGLGVALLYKVLAARMNRAAAAGIAFLVGLPAPVIMARENWDDHNRSGRYIATDFGYNYLVSCDDNAILYTFGDNDTFPLWYNQEVEGVGRSIKVANTMYLYSDWYYMQMMRRSYEAAPFATTAKPESIIGETRSHVYSLKQIGREQMGLKSLDIKRALEYAMDDKKRLKIQDREFEIFPSSELRLPVDREEVIRLGLVKDTSAIVPYLQFNITESGVSKNKLAALDFVANNFPRRPIYYGTTGDDGFYMGIGNNLRMEGLAFRLTPENTSRMPIDVEKTLDLLTNKFRYRGLNDPNVYLDETARRQVMFYRSVFFNLAAALKARGDKENMKRLMETYHEAIPEMLMINAIHSPYQRLANPVADYYFYAGLEEYGVSLSNRLLDDYEKEFDYYVRLAMAKKNASVDYELSRTLGGVKNLSDILGSHGKQDLQARAGTLFKKMGQMLQMN